MYISILQKQKFFNVLIIFKCKGVARPKSLRTVEPDS